MASQLREEANVEPSQESQNVDVPDIQKKLEQHKLDLKKRRTERINAITAAHQKRTDKLKRDYERAKTRHYEAIRAIRKPKAQRLLDLVQRKRQLVMELDNCQAQVQTAFAATAEKLKLAVDARVAALS
ncbi:hypothetical protein LTR62_006586 [Meristemomyces frigidus]|uniref:Uncharacterized protein n=1 Tax=Meristemomyces frigidus TaxID=1508187 RepID=A0AAN7YEC4_9PEZI|nr:hypothetical protein LTR62_006586 [Meristemomyces frigidus]